jgi:hypothetical protein
MPARETTEVSELSTFFKEPDISMGVFYPKHYIVASFPAVTAARQARLTLLKAGFPRDEVLAICGSEVLKFFEELRGKEGVWGELMSRLSRFFTTEAAFVEEDTERPKEGAGFLAIHCRTERQSELIKKLVSPFSPLSMHWYLPGGIRSMV